MTYEQLVEHYGSEAEAARALSVPQTTVNAWARNGIPHWRQFSIQIASDGKLKADKIKRNGKT